MLGSHTEVIAMNGKSRGYGSAERKPARIELLGSRLGSDCMVRNLSDVQAVLEVAQPQDLPVEFDLLIEPEQQPKRCGVVRRMARSVAVAFI
jgi:D-serine deaminase-like pyridoxal phosphate-dependent protein